MNPNLRSLQKLILWISLFTNIAFVTAFCFLERNDCESLVQEKDLLKQHNRLIVDYFWDRNFIIEEKILLDRENGPLMSELSGAHHIGLWISDKQCESCIEFCFTKIKSLPDSIMSKVIVFMDIENPRVKKMLEQKIPGSLKAINYRFYDSNPLFVSPVFALITPEVEVTEIFHATPNLPSITDFYMEKISLSLR